MKPYEIICNFQGGQSVGKIAECLAKEYAGHSEVEWQAIVSNIINAYLIGRNEERSYWSGSARRD